MVTADRQVHGCVSCCTVGIAAAQNSATAGRTTSRNHYAPGRPVLQRGQGVWGYPAPPARGWRGGSGRSRLACSIRSTRGLSGDEGGRRRRIIRARDISDGSWEGGVQLRPVGWTARRHLWRPLCSHLWRHVRRAGQGRPLWGQKASLTRDTATEWPWGRGARTPTRGGRAQAVRHGAYPRTASGRGRREGVRKTFGDGLEHGGRLPKKSVRRARWSKGGNTPRQHAPSVRSVDDIATNLGPSSSAGRRPAWLAEVGRFLQLGIGIHLN